MRTLAKAEYRPEHFLWIAKTAAEREPENAGAVARRLAVQGPALTFIVDGRVAACGGYTKPWPHLAEMWLAIDATFTSCPTVIVETKRQLNEWIRLDELYRVQAYVRSGWARGCRFVEWLGMQHEGTLRRFFSDGADAELYARVQ